MYDDGEEMKQEAMNQSSHFLFLTVGLGCLRKVWVHNQTVKYSQTMNISAEFSKIMDKFLTPSSHGIDAPR